MDNYKPSKNKSKVKNINQRQSDIAIGQLKQFITYKAESAGRDLILVEPAYTSQICPQCYVRKKKELKERQHSCQCGLNIPRDIASAKLILQIGVGLYTMPDFSG